MTSFFKKYIRFIIAIAALGTMTFVYQNCGQVAFQATSPSATVTAIKQFQPALAVRDISCLACHANVQANVITDFGYGNSWYLNQNDPGDAASYGNFHYLANTWQSLQQINGQVIVPDATVPSAAVTAALQSGAQAPSGAVSLEQYLTMTDIIDFSTFWTYQYWGIQAPTNLSLTNRVSPGAGSNPVITQPVVYIGVPTQQQIQGLVSNSSQGPWVQAIGSSSSGGITGFTTVLGINGQSYITNSGPVSCSGKDVVVNGTLLLNSLDVYAENGGCRLYVTGSVFIEGPINYLNSGTTADPSDNLQITSSTSIIMGVGLTGSVWNGGNTEHTGSISQDQYSTTPLQNRLLGDVRSNMLLRGASTSSAYNTYANGILMEGTNIGPNLIQDASDDGSTSTALSAAGQARDAINFNHILLNAPLIHSRYLGTVSGVIVAESAEFSLGEFSFNYDPVFQNVPVLPALSQDILCANADTSCNPISP